MPSSDARFAELSELLESKKGDFKRYYKIQTTGTLSAYDILNSPRVGAYLQSRKDGCAELTPGKFNSAATRKRLDIAREIARNKEIQNKDATFAGVAIDALNVAEAILTDGRKCRAYVEWLRDQEPEDAGASRLEELERKLEEAQARARQAEIGKRTAELDKERLQREAIERAKEEEEEKQPASTPGWADLFAKILVKAASSRGEAAAPAMAPSPQVNVSGAWASADGFHYEFYQTGNVVRMVVKQFAWGPVITDGQGAISGGVMNIRFKAMTPMGLTYGQAQAQVSPDGRRIQGYYENFNLNIRGAIELHR